VSYITRQLGIKLTAEQMRASGEKMGLVALPSDPSKVKFAASAIRSDILHACDISEEVGIVYGFNNIPMQECPTNTVGGFIPQNKFTDLMRHEVAQAGFIESLTFALVSMKENYVNLRYPVDENEAVRLSNPKTKEFEVVRTSLIPGLLKTLQSNQSERLPQKIFEISDTTVIDDSTDTGAKNVRRICIMQLNTQDNFEVIHGALGLLMTKISATLGKDYTLVEDENDRKFFPGRGAKVVLAGQPIGSIGVLHPEVLVSFELKNPVSVMEIDLEPVWQFFKSH
jgi:phenylalanyl-tRNA synthetase beta chain